MTQTLTRIPVFFRPEMVALDASSISPSAGKPAEVVADWEGRGLNVDLRSFDPVDEATLALAHDPAYVRGVLAGECVNGFGNRKPGASSHESAMPPKPGQRRNSVHDGLKYARYDSAASTAAPHV